MFWLVESQDQFDTFKYTVGKKIFIEPIYRHPEMHPGIYTPLAIYIKNIDQNKGYIVNLQHPEALPFDVLQVKDFLKNYAGEIYVRDRKNFNYFCYSQNSYDLNLNLKQQPENQNHTVNYFTQKYYDDGDLNAIIPIVKHYENCEALYEHYQQAINKYQPNQYQQELTDVFWFIERNALKVNSAFERYFDLKRPFLSRHGDWMFTQYNLNTTTGRPSNTFNNVNFAALNKENGCRSVFIPRNDILVEIDITAYHPTLIAQIVGYESPNQDIYLDFAQQYGMDREEAKNLVFKQLYGHIFDQYKDFEFFQLTSWLIEKTWKTFEATGKYTVVETGKVFSKDELPNMNPQKLFNYVIQHWETYNNVALLKEILYIMNGGESKVVLYVYDAILLDIRKGEKEKLNRIVNVFEDNKLKIKISYGPNYNALQSL